MSVEKIKQMLKTGVCPECGSAVKSDESMTHYVCSKDPNHFRLEVEFSHPGKSVSATYNRTPLSAEEISQIDW